MTNPMRIFWEVGVLKVLGVYDQLLFTNQCTLEMWALEKLTFKSHLFSEKILLIGISIWALS